MSVLIYSYVVLFVVLLLLWGICGVGWIWVEGKLLCGVDGDFKIVIGFWLYLGGED